VVEFEKKSICAVVSSLVNYSFTL